MTDFYKIQKVLLVSALLALTASCGWMGQRRQADNNREAVEEAKTATENAEVATENADDEWVWWRKDDTMLKPQFKHTDIGIADMGTDVRILLPTGSWAVPPKRFEPVLSEPWYELIYNSISERYELKKAELHLERDYNDCSGDSTVHVVSGRKALMFIGGLAPEREEVPAVALTMRRVWPGEELAFTFGDKAYKLRGEGVVSGTAMIYTDNGQERWDKVENYKLYLSENGGSEQLVAAILSFNDQFVTIRWIGDMDGDRKPDLLLDVSRHYEEEVVVLYLSSKAADGELVGAAALSYYDFSC
jgi:hypothetical protein